MSCQEHPGGSHLQPSRNSISACWTRLFSFLLTNPKLSSENYCGECFDEAPPFLSLPCRCAALELPGAFYPPRGQAVTSDYPLILVVQSRRLECAFQAMGVSLVNNGAMQLS